MRRSGITCTRVLKKELLSLFASILPQDFSILALLLNTTELFGSTYDVHLCRKGLNMCVTRLSSLNRFAISRDPIVRNRTPSHEVEHG